MTLDFIIDNIKAFWNCQDASIDDNGEIWIEGPQRGHWLDDEDYAKTINFLTERF